MKRTSTKTDLQQQEKTHKISPHFFLQSTNYSTTKPSSGD